MKSNEINWIRIRYCMLYVLFLIIWFMALSVEIIKGDKILIVAYLSMIIRDYIDFMSIIIIPKNVERRIRFLRRIRLITSIVAIPLLFIGILR